MHRPRTHSPAAVFRWCHPCARHSARPTEFETEAVHRPVEELTTITRGQHVTLAVAVVAVGQPACLSKEIVIVGHVVTTTATYGIFLR